MLNLHFGQKVVIESEHFFMWSPLNSGQLLPVLLFYRLLLKETRVNLS